MKAMPPCPHALNEKGQFNAVIKGVSRLLGWHYDARGWPAFESAVADARVKVLGSRLEFGADISFAKCVEDGIRLSFAPYVSQGTAIHPDDFWDMLSARSFTNGSDMEAVFAL